MTDEIVEELANEVTRQAGFGENSVRINWRGRFVARMVLAEPRYTSNYKFQTPKSGTIGIGGGNGALGLVMGKYLLEEQGISVKTILREERYERGDSMKEQIVVGTPGKVWTLINM